METKRIQATHAPAAIGPYAQGVQTGGFVFTSGQIPIDPGTGAIAEGGIAQQTAQALENLKNVLRAAGLGFGDVVKTTVFLQDMGDFAAMNDVYAQYFVQPYPARSCVQVARLPKDALIEIEAVAKCK